MNKNRTGRLLVLALFLAIVTAIVISGTFAKYTSSDNTTATAPVAKWSFSANGFNGVVRTDGIGTDLIAEDKLAPGTSGTMGVELNLSGCEVAVDYTIEISNIENKPTNLVFKNATKNTADDGTETYVVTGTLSIAEIEALEEGKKNVGIEWEWPYETGEGDEIVTNDGIDTQTGEEAKDMTFSVSIVGTQHDPSVAIPTAQ